MEPKKLIEFRNIVKNFDGQIVLKGVNLDIYEKEFVTLLGPSGCGKTTLLRILGGFLDADEGQVIFDGEEISKKPPYERELNTVFQKYALFPHLSVYENIAFGLKIKKMSKDIIDQKVMNLSGGNQQKVIIGKWLTRTAKVMVFDEPTRGIDVGAKYEIYSLMNDLSDQGIAIIMISSDLPEILGMSDRVAVFKDGRVTAVLDRKDADSEIIMKYATGKLS